jgi:hypothetical protein
LNINQPAVLAEVGALFARYEAALVSNDVAELDRLFWNSSYTVRYGTNENLYGFAEIAAFRSQRPATGLERRVIKTVITTFGDSFATTSIEFSRDNGVSGRQSQSWARLPEGWRVVAAHVSFLGQK